MPRIHRSPCSILIGLTGIGIGAFYLAKSFGYLPGIELTTYWPVLLILFGASRLIAPRSGASYFWGPVIIAAGGLFMAYNLNRLPFDPAQYWPVLLIILGLWIIARPLFKHGKGRNGSICSGYSDHSGKFERAESVLNDNEVNISLSMSGGKHICTGKDFTGGSIRLRAAGLELDLTSVESTRDEIVLDVDIKMGGIEMRIPQNWVVNYLGKTTMGSVENQTRPAPGPTKKLTLRGEIMLAGIEIRN